MQCHNRLGPRRAKATGDSHVRSITTNDQRITLVAKTKSEPDVQLRQRLIEGRPETVDIALRGKPRLKREEELTGEM